MPHSWEVHWGRLTYVRTHSYDVCLCKPIVGAKGQLFGAFFLSQRSGVNSRVLHFTFPCIPLIASSTIIILPWELVKLCCRMIQYKHTQPTSMPIWKVYTEKSINSFLTCRKKMTKDSKNPNTSFIMCHLLWSFSLKKLPSLLFKEKEINTVLNFCQRLGNS